MIWIYAVCAVLIYALIVVFAMKTAAPQKITMLPPGAIHLPTKRDVMFVTVGAFGGVFVLFMVQAPIAPPAFSGAQMSEDAVAPLAGLLDPKDAEAVTTYLRHASPQTPIPTSTTSLPDVETMISRLEARLEATPTDAKGWKTLAWAYQATGRDDLARSTYAKGLSYNPDDQDLKAAAGSSRSDGDVN